MTHWDIHFTHRDVHFSFHLVLLPSSPCWRWCISASFPLLPWLTHWLSSETAFYTLREFWFLIEDAMIFRRVICLIVSEVLLNSSSNIYTQAVFSHFHRWSIRLTVNISRLVFKYLCPYGQTKQFRHCPLIICAVDLLVALLVCFWPTTLPDSTQVYFRDCVQ